MGSFSSEKYFKCGAVTTALSMVTVSSVPHASDEFFAVTIAATTMTMLTTMRHFVRGRNCQR